MLQEQANGARAAGAPRRNASLAAAGVGMVLAPLTLFVLMLWVTQGAPLRPPGLSLDPELGQLPIERSN